MSLHFSKNYRLIRFIPFHIESELLTKETKRYVSSTIANVWSYLDLLFFILCFCFHRCYNLTSYLKLDFYIVFAQLNGLFDLIVFHCIPHQFT